MKVLFLDIDGVLNSTASSLAKTGEKWHAAARTAETQAELLAMIGGEFGYGQTFTFQTIDPTAVELINRLFEKEPELRLVLSSSHRSFFSNDETGIVYRSAEHLRALGLYLKTLGLCAALHDITPRLYEKRGVEVNAWLENSAGIETYVVIDDGRDFHAWQPLVLTDAKLGFTAADYFKAAALLRITESEIIF